MASDYEEEYGYFYDDDDAEEDASAGLEQDDAPPPQRRADCWAITQESLPTAQKQDLSTVMNLLNVKQHQARALLIHHRWRMDGIYDCLDKGRERMLRDAEVSSTFAYHSISSLSGWTQHFYAAVESGKKQIRCMAVKCPAFCDEDHVRRLLGQKYPEMAKRFNRFLLESYLEDNDSVKWCPSTPNCGRAIRVGAGECYCDVECPCGLSFCFNCMAQAHSPCPCTIWEKWNSKRSEGESIKWILANTKSCPKCFKAIEKNGGCNLVRCNCGQCMCWLCGGGTGLQHTWTSIAGHSCNRYKEETGGKTADTSRVQMQRYKHYYDRFKIHGDSYNVEKQKLGATLQERVRLLESDLKRPLAIRDGSFLIWPHRRLLVSRQVLSRSYVFAYYMFGGDLRTRPQARVSLAVARNLFEDHQEQLEQHVERLSGLLAGADVAAMPEAGIVEVKQKAVTFAKTVERLCGEMYKCIQDELLTLLVEPMTIAADRICDQLDRKGEDLMLAEANIVLPANGGMVPARAKKTPLSRSQRRVTCDVCFDDFSLRSVSAMDCGHTFCNDCWTGCFIAALDSSHKQIRCMAVKCPAVCDEAVVQRLLGREDPALAERFAGFLLRSYVDDNNAVRWCPSAPHCGRAIRVAAREVEPLCAVECPCGASFCFRCAAPAHSPYPRAMWERWEVKGRGEAENLKWILANTKSCPKCFNPIVKDGGCNHVRCKCDQCMCWLCGGATGSAHGWNSIRGHSCNGFMEEEKKKVDDARRHVRRYAHYYERFRIHGDSYKAEHGTLGPAVSERVKTLESGPFNGLRDSGWLADAHRSLLWFRQVLSRSYVFAYYMFDGTMLPTRRQQPETERGSTSTSMAQRQDLFESHQELLEGNVERRLSKLLSMDFPSLPTEEEIVQARREAAALVRENVRMHPGRAASAARGAHAHRSVPAGRPQQGHGWVAGVTLCRRAIKKESLSVAQQQDLFMVMGLFNIKQHHARALLIHYRWNTDRLNDHLERKGQDRTLMEAGVVLQENNSTGSSAGSKTPSRKKVTCNVCFEDFFPSAILAMDCGHLFCNACWTGYFVAALDCGKKQIRCMEFKCPVICDENMVQRLLGQKDPAAAERFHEFLLQSYVDDNSAVKWCPSVPHCGRAIRVADAEVEPLCEVECPCGTNFCFRCAATAHSPCPCAMWERWEAKGYGEEENVKWLLANTKNCPKCFKPIIKEEGCNLVTCKCGQHLCWLCGGATGFAHTWTSIANHSCNRFEAEEKKKVDDAMRHVRRYEHYYSRFQNHGLSCKTEREQLGPAVAEHVSKLESHSSILIKDASWLANAHRSLLGCRQVLMRSYVFAYYMFDSEETRTRQQEPGSLSMAQRQDLFEDYQEQVEANVERLSKLLGTKVAELPDEEILQARQHAINLVTTVEAHCGKMYSSIQDELLPMLVEPMSIASYQPGGPSKAKESPA
ncbi:putative E3 ubiquitin-protein ligase ARI2 [Dichanthelium oligosanthes]|uniref:RBR-type E3 ubiquitin transferase n=1 Tax=Dichanthelium oligosanthes TaxID=888268 RepID=A0A1E5VW88_9POAL|nr:putative E3 ubiquitin-protein ligase ARI2 [Dichanthelium oligosanthes]